MGLSVNLNFYKDTDSQRYGDLISHIRRYVENPEKFTRWWNDKIKSHQDNPPHMR